MHHKEGTIDDKATLATKKNAIHHNTKPFQVYLPGIYPYYIVLHNTMLSCPGLPIVLSKVQILIAVVDEC